MSELKINKFEVQQQKLCEMKHKSNKHEKMNISNLCDNFM